MMVFLKSTVMERVNPQLSFIPRSGIWRLSSYLILLSSLDGKNGLIIFEFLRKKKRETIYL